MSLLYQDYLVYIDEHELKDFSKIKRWLWLITRTTFPIILCFRLAHHQNKLVKCLFIPLYKLTRIISGVQIPRGTVIGKGLFLPHFGTIVLNKKAVFGDFLTIYHGVTVGAKGSASGVIKSPVIGNNIRLSTNSIILGDISIGDNSTIGAGSVVVKSIPENSIAVGNPAKTITKKVD